MAYQENQFRVCVEFLRSSSGMNRIIRLNHTPTVLPPQLAGRLHPAFWQAFMEDAGQLSLRHPYTARPTAKNCCTWAACFGLGAVVGLFCVSPDAGDYGAWEADCGQLVDRWAPGFAAAGAQLSLQRHRLIYWLQIDIDPRLPLPPQPVAPPLPQPAFAAPAGAAGVAPPAAGPAPGAPPPPPAAAAAAQQGEPLKPGMDSSAAV